MKRESLLAIAAMSLGGLLFGFDSAVIAGTTDALRNAFQLSAVGLGMAVSIALWGTLLGSVLIGAPGDHYGSRDMLKVIALFYLVSALGCALAAGLDIFLFCRFIGGLAIGGSSVLVPAYIAEISPAARRGQQVGLFQLNIVIGILLAYLSNALIDLAITSTEAWRWKFGVAALPALILLVMLQTVPQSPRWLIARGRRDDADRAMEKLSMTDDDLCSFATEARKIKISWADYRKPILLAILLALFNQLSGINAILYYLNDIFAAAGFSSLSANIQAVAIGVANLIATLFGLSLIDRIGRKQLLLTGSLGTLAALVAVAIIYTSGTGQRWLLPALIGFIIFFAISQGAVIWVYLSEIFPTEVRARGMAIGSATHWGANAVLAQLFPVLSAVSQALPFWIFAACMALQFVVVKQLFPETKGASLEELAQRLH